MTGASYWRGERVVLRAVEPEDWSAYHAWNEDDDQARRLYFVPFPQSREGVRRRTEQIAATRPEDDTFRFVIANHQGEVVGDLTTNECNRRMGTFSYGVSIAAPHRRKGYASEAITIVLRYYFEELRYQKVHTVVYSFNEPSLRLHERLGFAVEGRQRRMIYSGGHYHDLILVGLTAEEFTERYRRTNASLPPGT